MRIILDAMGGDNAPLSPLEGAARAVSELGIEVVLSGDENKIRLPDCVHAGAALLLDKKRLQNGNQPESHENDRTKEDRKGCRQICGKGDNKSWQRS